MRNVKKLLIPISLVLFPLWGVLLPLKVFESNMVYADPPTPSFIEFLQLYFSVSDLLTIGAGWLFLALAAFLMSKSDTRFIVITYFAAVIFFGYSFFLFASVQIFIIKWQLGISIVLTQGLMYILARMLNVDNEEPAQ